MFEASVQQNKNKKHMKNFEAQTAKELLNKIEYYYPKTLAFLNDKRGTTEEYIFNMNMVRSFVDSSQVLFNLEGLSITEVIEELKKISGTL